LIASDNGAILSKKNSIITLEIFANKNIVLHKIFQIFHMMFCYLFFIVMKLLPSRNVI